MAAPAITCLPVATGAAVGCRHRHRNGRGGSVCALRPPGARLGPVEQGRLGARTYASGARSASPDVRVGAARAPAARPAGARSPTSLSREPCGLQDSAAGAAMPPLRFDPHLCRAQPSCGDATGSRSFRRSRGSRQATANTETSSARASSTASASLRVRSTSRMRPSSGERSPSRNRGEECAGAPSPCVARFWSGSGRDDATGAAAPSQLFAPPRRSGLRLRRRCPGGPAPARRASVLTGSPPP